MSQFKLFISLCAARVGSELNMNTLANSCQISSPTAKSWLSVLERSYILFQLKPYYRNYNKRITKRPKIFFYDTGLVCHLLGIRSADQLDFDKDKGRLFENFIVSEIIKSDHHNDQTRDWWYWRTSHGKEIDLLRESRGGYSVYEIKASTTVKSDFFKVINQFSEIAQTENVKRFLLYGGKQSYVRSGINIVGWPDVIKLK